MEDIIDRKSLLIYLDDLRTLETIVHESEATTNSLDEKYKLKIKSISSKTDNCKEQCSDIIVRTPYIKESEWLPVMRLWEITFYAAAIFMLLCFKLMTGISGFIPALICIGVGLALHALRRKKINNVKTKNNMILESNAETFNRNNKICKECKNKVRIEIDKITDEKTLTITPINNEIAELHEALEEAYSANIIPLQFRNIRGIYYLYDYLSTSNQTLSEALKQCNLEAIKEKLDKMIDLQGELIIEQAKANQIIFKQNQQILDQAYQINKNTAAAAAYSKISACNSMLSVKMQSESLAYQRINMFLK